MNRRTSSTPELAHSAEIELPDGRRMVEGDEFSLDRGGRFRFLYRFEESRLLTDSIKQLCSFFKMGIQSIPLIHAIKMRKAMRAMYLNLQTAATDSPLLAAKTLEPFFEKIHKKLRVGVVSYPFSNGLAFMI